MRLGHHFQGQKVKGQLAGTGAYCGGLLHSLFKQTAAKESHILHYLLPANRDTKLISHL